MFVGLPQQLGHFQQTLDKADQLRAFNLAVRCIAMIRCSFKRSSLVRSTSIVWNGDKSVKEMIASALPLKDPITLDDDQGSSIGFQITANRLKRCHNVKFRGTDDIRRHLLLDPRKKVIFLFHHTVFLKEHLIKTKNRDPNSL